MRGHAQLPIGLRQTIVADPWGNVFDWQKPVLLASELLGTDYNWEQIAGRW